DPGEALAEHAAHPPSLHRQRHVLARGPDPEVPAGHDDRVLPELVAQRRVVALEQVRLHRVGILDVEELARVHHVGVDVVALDHHGASFDDHALSSPGSMISPATAEAAATYALARCTSASREPIRPRKLRLVVAIARSPAPSTPMPPPKQAPQVGVETIAPASTNRSNRPSLKARR